MDLKISRRRYLTCSLRPYTYISGLPVTYLVPVDSFFDRVDTVRAFSQVSLGPRRHGESLSPEDVDAVVRLDRGGAVAQALVRQVEQLSGVGPAV